MGGKQRRWWKHLQVLVASLVALVFIQGCLPTVEVKKRAGMMAKGEEKNSKPVLKWEERMKSGEYDEFMKEAQGVYQSAEDPQLKQKALYYMALTQIHPENPSRDLKRAEGYFRKLIVLYPDGIYAQESRVWLGLISIIEKSKKIDIEIEKKKQEFSR